MNFLTKLFGKKEPESVVVKPRRPVEHLFLTTDQMEARKRKEPEKFISTKVCGQTYVLPESEYNKQVARYARFKRLLLSMCRGQCAGCLMSSFRCYDPLEYSCRLQTLLDPERNKLDNGKQDISK
jgi:hypothetical protein